MLHIKEPWSCDTNTVGHLFGLHLGCDTCFPPASGLRGKQMWKVVIAATPGPGSGCETPDFDLGTVSRGPQSKGVVCGTPVLLILAVSSVCTSRQNAQIQPNSVVSVEEFWLKSYWPLSNEMPLRPSQSALYLSELCRNSGILSWRDGFGGWMQLFLEHLSSGLSLFFSFDRDIDPCLGSSVPPCTVVPASPRSQWLQFHCAE